MAMMISCKNYAPFTDITHWSAYWNRYIYATVKYESAAAKWIDSPTHSRSHCAIRNWQLNLSLGCDR
jgi:hypothetical protein